MFQNRTDNTALRRAGFCRKELLLNHKSCLEPLLEHRFVNNWNVVDEPLMADSIKTPGNVSFQYPLGAIAPGKADEALFSCISR